MEKNKTSKLVPSCPYCYLNMVLTPLYNSWTYKCPRCGHYLNEGKNINNNMNLEYYGTEIKRILK